MKHIIIIFNLIFLAQFGFSQKSSLENQINLYNDKNKKNGFWSEMENGIKYERYYVNGTITGIEKSYYRNGTLMSFFEYKNGHRKNVGYFFHEKGYLGFTVKYLGPVLYKKEKLQKGYFTEYNSDGHIKESGMGLFKEGDEELGEEIRLGKWKVIKK